MIINRILYFISFLGVILTTHLWIQKNKNFSDGCIGIGLESLPGCNAVLSSNAATLYGVPIIIFGFIFYVIFALLSLTTLLISSHFFLRLFILRYILIISAFAYSVFLTIYQLVILQSFCPLCFTSAVLVTLMTILVHYQFFSKSISYDINSSNEAVSYLYISILGIFLFIGFIFFLNPIGNVSYSSFQKEINTLRSDFQEQFSELSITKSPSSTKDSVSLGNSSKIPPSSNCKFDLSYRHDLDINNTLSSTQPFIGNKASKDTFVMFFDPLCPHCRKHYPIVKKFMNDKAASIRFYFIPLSSPRSLYWSTSAYAGGDSFYEIIDLIMTKIPIKAQPNEVMTKVSDFLKYDKILFNQMLFSESVKSNYEKGYSVFQKYKFKSVPVIMINGKVVNSKNISYKCFEELFAKN